MRTEREERHQSDDGFVLVTVLFALALLGAIAMILVRTAELDVRVNADRLREAEAEAWSNGLVQLAAYQLAAQGSGASGASLPTNGTPLICRIGQGMARVAAFDAAGLVDINFAPQNVLERLLEGVDLPRQQAEQLADSIVDFRTLNDLHDTVIMANYVSAGRPYGPKHAPFATIGELEQVLGMTRKIYARLRPYVTVHSRMINIDPDVASAGLQAMQLPADFPSRVTMRTFIIRAVARIGEASFVREAAIELSPRESTGFLLREWTRLDGLGAANPPAYDSEAPACLNLLLGR